MSNARVEPRRRCAFCRAPTNRCPCPVCGACSTDAGAPGAVCGCSGRGFAIVVPPVSDPGFAIVVPPVSDPGFAIVVPPVSDPGFAIEGEPGALADLPPPLTGDGPLDLAALDPGDYGPPLPDPFVGEFVDAFNRHLAREGAT